MIDQMQQNRKLIRACVNHAIIEIQRCDPPWVHRLPTEHHEIGNELLSRLFCALLLIRSKALRHIDWLYKITHQRTFPAAS